MFIKYYTTVYPLKIGYLADSIIPEDLKKSILGDKAYDFIKADNESFLIGDSIAYVQAVLGGVFLNFIPDADNVALHSQPDTWQRVFGYNDLYDLAFELGSDMLRCIYRNESDSYRIWLWKGDYWNLRSGAEIGLYVKDEKASLYSDTPVFDAINFEVPMSIALYNKVDGNNKFVIKENVFNWVPERKQWWVTGFNWKYQNPKAQNMVVFGAVNLIENQELYDSFSNNNALDNMIFDDATHKIWILWTNEK